jgi:hypothetical protein
VISSATKQNMPCLPPIDVHAAAPISTYLANMTGFG